jgi:hypothetical protein
MCTIKIDFGIQSFHRQMYRNEGRCLIPAFETNYIARLGGMGTRAVPDIE